MKKKLISALAAVIAAVSICMAAQMPATAYTDNNGNYHAYEYSAIRSFPNANNYFLQNYGRREVQLTYPISTRYGSSVGTLHCYFNYETIGTSYAQQKTSTWINGYYMDGFVSSNGSYRYSSTRLYNNYSCSMTNVLSIYGSNSVSYLGSIYH